MDLRGRAELIIEIRMTKKDERIKRGKRRKENLLTPPTALNLI